MVLFSNTKRDFTLVIYKKKEKLKRGGGGVLKKRVFFLFSMNFRGKWGFRCLILKVKRFSIQAEVDLIYINIVFECDHGLVLIV